MAYSLRISFSFGMANRLNEAGAGFGFPHGFQRRHFGFLRLADAVARFVAQNQYRQNRRHAESCGDAEAFFGNFTSCLRKIYQLEIDNTNMEPAT